MLYSVFQFDGSGRIRTIRWTLWIRRPSYKQINQCLPSARGVGHPCSNFNKHFTLHSVKQKICEQTRYFNFLIGLAGFEPTLNMIVEVATAIIINQWLLSTEGDGHPYSRFDNHSTQTICGQTRYFQYFQWTFFLSFYPLKSTSTRYAMFFTIATFKRLFFRFY